MTNHEETIVKLPDLIRGGRNPWTGTVADLIRRELDRREETLLTYASEQGLIDADKIADEDAAVYEPEYAKFEAMLPGLLATDLEALRRFTDDPNATVEA